MEEKKNMIKDGEVEKASGGYKEGDIIHDYCPWCGCAAEGVFTTKTYHGIAGYQIEMHCTSCGKKFYHSYE